MAEEAITKRSVRCFIGGEVFDFNQDLGAVELGRGAACTPCMDRLFAVKTVLSPNGERPLAFSKVKKKSEPFRYNQKR